MRKRLEYIQVLLGFIHDTGGADACRDTKTFFCHAVEWSKISPRSPDGSGASGEPSNLDFDPFRSDLLVTYHRARSAPWVAKVLEVRLVAAAERAAEIRRNLREMNASYYYRFQLGDLYATQSRMFLRLCKGVPASLLRAGSMTSRPALQRSNNRGHCDHACPSRSRAGRPSTFG
jgi:hypothetical protein